MKLGAFSDAHVHPFPAFAKIGSDGLNSRLRFTSDRIEDIVRISQDAGCEALLFGGDWFHTKTVAAETIDVAVRAVAGAKIPIIGVPGNHDQATHGGNGRHSARAMSSKIQWLDDVGGRETLISSGKQTVKVYGIPYVHDKNALLAELDNVPKGVDILLMHAGFAGGFMGSDYIADLGDCIDYMAVKGKAKLVISGHFHQPQLITFNKAGDIENARPSVHGPQHGIYEDGHAILVPGAPEQHTWGDKDSARGFWIIDTEEHKVHFHKLNSPQFVEIAADQTCASFDAKDYYRFLGSCSEETLKTYKQFAPNFIVEATPTFAARPQRAFEVGVSDAPSTLVKKYVDTAETTLDRERLIAEGQRLLGCN